MVDFKSLAMMSTQCGSILIISAALLLSGRKSHHNTSIPNDILNDMITTSIDDLDLRDSLRPPSKRRWRRVSSTSDESTTPRKKRMVLYDRERAYQCVMDDYLHQNSKFDDRQFERHHRITRGLFQWTLEELAKDDPFWTQKPDCTGRPGIAPEVKLLAALKLVCYGVSFSAFQSYFQMGESTARECVSRMSQGMFNNKNIREKYLRQMTKSDARKVEKMHSTQHGVNGMLGSIDVMQVCWENCPYEQRGQHIGKNGKPTLGLEAVADNSLWFWHSDFGFPGALNDINIWDRSELHNAMVDGTHDELDFEFILDDEIRRMLWYLADGIYPELARFVKTMPVPLTKKEKYFTSWQEAKRKDIERAFGVLEKKFNILVTPVRLFHVQDIFFVVKACIALHNMMVEVRVNSDETESVNFYEEVHEEVNGTDTDSTYVDPAVQAIDAEDAVFENNADLLNMAGDNVDVELMKKYKAAQLLGRKIRIVERRWKTLSNTEEHFRLQSSVMNHVANHVRDEE